nr:hypothetical protein CFP56_50746 [Quercus suber]
MISKSIIASGKAERRSTVVYIEASLEVSGETVIFNLFLYSGVELDCSGFLFLCTLVIIDMEYSWNACAIFEFVTC